MKLNFIVQGQCLSLSSAPSCIVGGSVNYLDASFNFSKEWDGLVKVAFFACGENKFEAFIDAENCIREGINLGHGVWSVNVIGTQTDGAIVAKRIPTGTLAFTVAENGTESGDPFPEVTPTLAEKILAASMEAVNAANQVKKAAENGEFDGEDAKITDVTASVDSGVGTPSIEVGLGGDELNRSFHFDFHNLRGKDAEIADVSASVDDAVGTPEVDVEVSGEPTKRSLKFNFKKLKGDPGKDAKIIDVTASVNNDSGTPQVNVTMGGTETERSFNFDFLNLKGKPFTYEDFTPEQLEELKGGGLAKYATEVIDDTAVMIKNTPETTAPYAEVKEIGGMTHKVNVGTEDAPVYELHNAPVTEVKSVGANLLDVSIPIPEAVQALYGYGWGINADCYNYVDLVNKQFIQRVGCVDMGTLNWSLKGSNTLYFAASVSDRPAGVGLVLCAPYDYDSTGLHKNNLTISTNWKTVKNAVNVRDDNYTDAETFKAAMSGVMLYYELATPVITDISDLLPADDLIRVEENGTVTMVNEQGYDMPNRIVFYKAVNKAVASEIFVGDLTGKAQRAIGDENGNNIMKTYATKEELAEMLATIMSLIEGGNNT